MAIIQPTVNQTSPEYALKRWNTLLNGDSGAGIQYLRQGDRAAQVLGTFGVGGTVIIEGSLDGDNWAQLRDPSGTLISFTAAGVRAILEATPFIRPRVTAGDGTTSINCLISARRD